MQNYHGPFVLSGIAVEARIPQFHGFRLVDCQDASTAA